MAAATGGGMHNLTTLIKRLEAATSRLEDIACSAAAFEHAAAPPRAEGDTASRSAPELPGLAQSAEAAAVAASAAAATTTAAAASTGGANTSASSPGASQPAAPSLPPALEAMDELMATDLDKFVKTAQGLDKNIADQAQAVARAFAAQRQYLLVTTKSKKPDMTAPAFSELIEDLQKEMGTVTDIKDSNRASPFKDQLAMVGEGMGALQWVVFEGKPADYVAEVLGGVQLFGNRVLKEYKEKDPAHVTYVQSYYALWKNLQAYIKKFYPTGVTWNNSPSGVELGQALKDVKSGPSANGAPAAPAAAAGGPPPPPPPPPLPTFENAPPPPPAPAAKSGAGATDMGAVFEQLNKGESVTSGLRKVDKSEMTHKNPSLRASAVVPERKGSADSISRPRSRGPELKPKPEGMRARSQGAPSPVAKKTPKKELDGNKWIIENWEDAAAPVEVEVSLVQSVLISRCKKTTIVLRGKANAVSIDNCMRTNLIIDSLVSSVDVIKSPNFALQVLGSLPTVMLDQVDGAAIYLGKDSLATEIYTSKCASVNINIPPKSEDDDYRECPLPEQIRTVIKDGQLVNDIVEHAG